MSKTLYHLFYSSGSTQGSTGTIQKTPGMTAKMLNGTLNINSNKQLNKKHALLAIMCQNVSIWTVFSAGPEVVQGGGGGSLPPCPPFLNIL